jgi:CBS domain-containing protein
MIDLLDMITYVLSVPMDAPTWGSEVLLRFNTPIYRAIDFSGRDPVVSVSEHTKVAQVITTYFKKGIHRVLVRNSSSNIVGILAQVDVLRFLKKQMLGVIADEAVVLGARSLCEFDLPNKVICIQDTSNLLAAFQLITSNRVSSIAVVNNDRALVGNVSATDFQNISSQTFTGMGVMLQQYLTSTPVYAKPSTSVLGAVRMMCENNVHRIYIVDNKMCPTKVFSITDLMNIAATELNLEGLTHSGGL